MKHAVKNIADRANQFCWWHDESNIGSHEDNDHASIRKKKNYKRMCLEYYDVINIVVMVSNSGFVHQSRPASTTNHICNVSIIIGQISVKQQ